MAGAGGYSVVISATDAASGVLDQVNKRVEALNKRVALAAVPFKRLHENLDKFARVTGLDRIATGFKDVGEAAGQAWRGLSRVLEPLAAIVGAASLAGIYKLASAWGDFATQLGIQAQRAGVSADSLFALQNAAKLAGVSADALTGGLTAMTDNLRNAAFGGAPEFLQVLDKLHVSYAELKKQSPEQQVRTLANALSRVGNVTDRALFAKMLFGSEGLLPLLNKGGAGIDALVKRARHFGGVVTLQDLKNAQKFHMAQEDLNQSVKGFGNAVAAVVGPALTPYLEDLAEGIAWMRQWVEANKAWLSSAISEEVGRVVRWLRSYDWIGLGHSMEAIALRADGVAKSLGGWQAVGEDVALFFGARFLTQMLLPFLNFGLVVGRIGVAFSGLMIDAFTAVGGAAVAFGKTVFAVMAETVLPAVMRAVAAIGTSLAASFEAAGVAAATFSKGTMALPIWRLLGGAGALLSVLSLSGDTPQATPGEPYDGPPRDWDEVIKQHGAPVSALSREDPLGEGHWRPTWLGGAPDVKPISLADSKANARAMDKVYQAAGMTREGSASMLGSGMGETRLDPRAGVGTGHQGTFQWEETRRKRIEAQFGITPTQMTPAQSAEASVWELKKYFPQLWNQLTHSHDEVANNNAVTRVYEAPGVAALLGSGRPGDIEWEVKHRLGFTRGALADLAGGDPAPLPAGQQGAPGASGKVDVNVRVSGQPAAVTAQSRGDVGLNIAAPGLLGVP